MTKILDMFIDSLPAEQEDVDELFMRGGTYAAMLVGFLIIGMAYTIAREPIKSLLLPTLSLPVAAFCYSEFSRMAVSRGWYLNGLVYFTGAIIGWNLLLWERGAGELVWLLLIVIAGDTGAFITGKLAGANKLMENVSSGKTWEGLAGGVVLAIGVGILIDLALAKHHPVSFTLGIALASVVGDLLISKAKRLSGMKDSGMLFPGHGGMLDRIDGQLAAIWAYGLLSLY